MDRRALASHDETAAIPVWAQGLGTLLLLAFLALSVDAYVGPGLRNRLLAFASAPDLTSIPPIVFYQAGSTVRVGQTGVGSEGQDRTLQEGDVILLGETGQLVRLGPGGRTAEIRATEGATTVAANLGAWDRAADRLTGVPAHVQGGRWVLDQSPLQTVGADLHPAGAPGEALTEGFKLGPDPEVGRVRRVGDRAIRIRASRKTPTMMLETREPLPSLDGTLVSVTAVVRGQPGKTIVLALEDAVDASGTAESVSERRAATEEWTRLSIRRRVVFPSENDKISIGLLEAEAGDWIEVRDFDVRLGVAP